MLCCFLFLSFCFCGSIGAPSQAGIDIGSIQHTSSRVSHPYFSHNSLSLETNQIYRTNDYNDNSSRFAKLQAPLQFVYTPKITEYDEKIPLKVHEPREDPKLFYQSDIYLKEIDGRNINQEVASIYPGRQYIRADEKYRVPKHMLRSYDENRSHVPTQKKCIQCPHDRTLIAKVGADRVFLQSPSLKTCSGRKAPTNVRFVHMYGAKFGTLLEQGSHVVLGRLMYKNQSLQVCKMQVHVIVQTCPTPKYLISHCEGEYKPCNFTCRDKTLELLGESALFCGEDMKWEGFLPQCRARNWCKPLPPPDRGQISCRGDTAGLNSGLVEGSRCRIRCPSGWRWHDKAVSVCRRGTWTNILKCTPKKEKSK
ncbi:uncharacterized protein LOC126772062 isoform X2 [Nymphalis io]|uniref:uncharacterized protein LOC126772062 isoform X2 n=1 Tax=Inachis io TaxID=171585 RepID=UPI00216782E2|nr:uncharacterized protein LOC126772062 isoform X2 [Nymphalis io]